MNVLPLLALLIALQPTAVYPGENVTLTLDEKGTYFLQLADSCTYFKDSGTTTLTAGKGSYVIETRFTCEPGYKYVIVNKNGKEVKVKFEVKEPTYDYLRNATIKLDNEIFLLKAQLNDLNAENEKLNATIENLTTSIEALNTTIENYKKLVKELQKENENVVKERDTLKAKIKDLEKKIENLQNDKLLLESKLKESGEVLSSLEGRLTNLEGLVNILKTVFLFVLSLLAGSYVAILRRR